MALWDPWYKIKAVVTLRLWMENPLDYSYIWLQVVQFFFCHLWLRARCNGEHNQICEKAEKMDMFSVIKDYITLRRIFGTYWTVMPTREVWNKDWPNWLRKGQVWFTDGACNQQGTGAGICKYQSKIQWHISATAFQAVVAAILDCVTSCLRKRLVKEQITICTNSQQPSSNCSPSSKWYKITACSALYKKADSSVSSKLGNQNVGT